MLCQDCKKKDKCTQLCEEAGQYAGQDYKGQRELPVGLLRGGKFPAGSSGCLTPREREIVTLLGRGLSRIDVCELLDISKHVLRNHLYNLRQKQSK